MERGQHEHEELKINQGRILAELHRQKRSTNLQDYEFKIFSQWGEDGIIQKIVDSVEIKNKTFIEFGIQDFSESNCRFLMMKDNWSGFVMDGGNENIARLKNAPYYWQYELNAVEAFITKENINALLLTSGFDKDLGILSIDLDGNDYWILNEIKNFTPRILILEYNAVFGPAKKISVPYEPDFQRTRKHHSNLYWGASLAALASKAFEKGYALVGTNSAGCNAFFVRNDLMNEKLTGLSAAEAFTASKYRESRLADGTLSYASGTDRLKLISGMPVVDIESGKMAVL